MSHLAVTVNLLPCARRRKLATVAAATRWTWAACALAGLTLLPAVAFSLNANADLAPILDRTAREEAAFATLSSGIPAMKQELIRQTALSKVLVAVEDRVDWRPLLGTIATLAPDVGFERIECKLDRTAHRAEIRLIGMVPSLAQARDLVLRLEDHGSFDSVTLANSSTLALPGREVIRFEITAVVRPKGGA
ncbi:MAG: hypothetical protein D6692_03160 [Planctomycetota bacterium]|nr:MAG: hypothetical protein D6692_03160 [Planctomycetota bacterium]